MSGGVDSSVAALLTKESGDQCIGATMKLFHNEDVGIKRGQAKSRRCFRIFILGQMQ